MEVELERAIGLGDPRRKLNRMPSTPMNVRLGLHVAETVWKYERARSALNLPVAKHGHKEVGDHNHTLGGGRLGRADNTPLVGTLLDGECSALQVHPVPRQASNLARAEA